MSQGADHDCRRQRQTQGLGRLAIDDKLDSNDLASVEGLYTETHDHRQACARTSLAASQRSALVVQEIYRWGSGLAFLRMGVRRRPCHSFTMLTSRSTRRCGQRAAVALGANRPRARDAHRAALRPADQRQKLAGCIEELPRLIFFLAARCSLAQATRSSTRRSQKKRSAAKPTIALRIALCVN